MMEERRGFSQRGPQLITVSCWAAPTGRRSPEPTTSSSRTETVSHSSLKEKLSQETSTHRQTFREEKYALNTFSVQFHLIPSFFLDEDLKTTCSSE